MSTAVVNASPLITSAKADLLNILPNLFSFICVPHAVVEEILKGPENDPMRSQIHQLEWLRQVNIEKPLTPLVYWQLGRGETEVIEYARLNENTNTIALLDDKYARRVAMALNIQIMGTLGIIAKTASDNLDIFDRMIAQLRDSGLFLDEKVISAVRNGINK